MSKSTPLNQLPIGQPTQNIFVTDQQRQMVNQAQQAQQSFQMPQNTTAPAEGQDDETSVIEVLNQLNNNVQSSVEQMTQPPPPPPQLPQPDAWRQINDIAAMSGPAAFGSDAMLQPPALVEKKQQLVPFMNNADIMTVVYVVAAVILLQFIPVENMIGKYIALDKIPYSGILIKAVLAGIIVVAMQHFFR